MALLIYILIFFVTFVLIIVGNVIVGSEINMYMLTLLLNYIILIMSIILGFVFIYICGLLYIKYKNFLAD